jgi:hypothetical protein
MSTLKKLAGGVATTALILGMASAVHAQETTSAIGGQVLDENSAPVANATVVVTHVPSGTRSTVVTDAAGSFQARGLRVGGPFQVSVTAAEFETETVADVFTQIGETTDVPVSLYTAGAVEAVVVTASRAARNTGVQTTLDQERIEGVVSVTRDIRDLARRNPLVSQNSRGDGGISIAGSNPRTNRIAIDGVQAQDDYGLNTGGTPVRRGPVSLDAIEQFSVIAVPVDVENGDFSGGALDVVLRSGGNELEGSLFVNYLNDGLVQDSFRGQRRRRASPSRTTAPSSRAHPRGRAVLRAVPRAVRVLHATATGPRREGFPTTSSGDQARRSIRVGIFETNYATDFEVGTIPALAPILDEPSTRPSSMEHQRQHRATLSYRYSALRGVQPCGTHHQRVAS